MQRISRRFAICEQSLVMVQVRSMDELHSDSPKFKLPTFWMAFRNLKAARSPNSCESDERKNCFANSTALFMD